MWRMWWQMGPSNANGRTVYIWILCIKSWCDLASSLLSIKKIPTHLNSLLPPMYRCRFHSSQSNTYTIRFGRKYLPYQHLWHSLTSLVCTMMSHKYKYYWKAHASLEEVAPLLNLKRVTIRQFIRGIIQPTFRQFIRGIIQPTFRQFIRGII